MNTRLNIVKIGGHVLDDDAALEKFLHHFALLDEPKILVHGGGKQASQLSRQLGIEPKLINGRRITDASTLEVVTMVYGGLINKKVVTRLQQFGCNALGLTGADGNLIRATRRPPDEVDYGFAGDVTPKGINTSLLYFLLRQNTVPVIAPLTHENGTLLNTNADTLASVLAIALCMHFHIRLVYCFEKRGVLHNPNDDQSVIPVINTASYHQLLAEGVINNGMLPKLQTAFAAAQQGVPEVIITHAANFTAKHHAEIEGTRIMK
ncbi:MAG: acetylglutamate kinase [Cyclobacteriaceae bacterium]|nr:MAG: acetylglutamate kinase [Cyclobacteriaceae bacterium]